MTSTSTEGEIQKCLNDKAGHVMRIVGDITPASIDILEKEIGRLFTTIKSYHFMEGQKYGYLAVIVGQTHMR